MPKYTSGQINVDFQVDDSSPEQTEQQATSILENAFSNLRGLKNINSVSRYNGGRIELNFENNEKMEFKSFEVISMIRQIYPNLPPQVSYPVTSQTDNEKENPPQPLLVFSISSNDDNQKIKTVTDELIKKKLVNIKGVREVIVSGITDKQVSIKFNIDLMRALSLNQENIISAINSRTKDFFPGMFKDKDHSLKFIQIRNSNISLKDLAALPVADINGKPIARISQLASVSLTDKKPANYFRVNGRNAVRIGIQGQANTNLIELASRVKSEMQIISKNLPKGYEIILNYDDTEFLRKEIIKNYQRTIIALLVLMIFIFFAYRNWKHILNLFLTLFVNLSLTVLFVWFLNIDIHIYTLAGMAIAFGIIIDHAIVMVDYYDQYKNRNVIYALLAATLSTIAALSLVYFLPADQRVGLSDFALVIVFALISSIITNLWFTTGVYNALFDLNSSKPAFTNFKRIRKFSKVSKWYLYLITQIALFRKSFIVFIVFLFGVPLFVLPEKIEGSDVYNKSFGTHVYREKIAPILEPATGGFLRLFAENIYENANFRELKKTQLFVNAELPIGNSLEQMNYAVHRMENYISTFPAVDRFITNVNSGQRASILITFRDSFESGTQPLFVKSELSLKAQEWGGVKWKIFGIGQGFSSSVSDKAPSFKVKLSGYNYDQLRDQMKAFGEKLSVNKRVQSINYDDRIDADETAGVQNVLNLDPLRTQMVGMDSRRLFLSVGDLTPQNTDQTKISISGKFYPVKIESNVANEFSTWDLLNSNMPFENKYVRLGDFGKLTVEKTSGSIVKENREFVKILSFEYLGPFEAGSQFLRNKLVESNKQMPIGYKAVREGNIWGGAQDANRYYLLGLLLVLNYIICSILFEDLIQPLGVIALIPISMIGHFAIFYLFDFPFDQGGFAAFIMLGGLVVNAGVYIVNDLNARLRRKQSSHYNSDLIFAILNRGRTILLTTIAAICGLLPFLFDGENEPFWFSLSIGTIGGLIFSMFAIFIALPVFLFRLPEKVKK